MSFELQQPVHEYLVKWSLSVCIFHKGYTGDSLLKSSKGPKKKLQGLIRKRQPSTGVVTFSHLFTAINKKEGCRQYTAGSLFPHALRTEYLSFGWKNSAEMIQLIVWIGGTYSNAAIAPDTKHIFKSLCSRAFCRNICVIRANICSPWLLMFDCWSDKMRHSLLKGHFSPLFRQRTNTYRLVENNPQIGKTWHMDRVGIETMTFIIDQC